MYLMTPTGLPCDAVRVDTATGAIDCDVLDYHMRPEAVETWFYMYRLTGEQKYKDWAWKFYLVFQFLFMLELSLIISRLKITPRRKMATLA
jgi:mannosyl-oligosaccharide alpha-1,2-mannosidase